MNLLLLLYPTAATLYLFALGLGVGRLVLRPWRGRFDSPLEFYCLAGGIGMGILSHVMLLLGLWGGWQANGLLAAGMVMTLAAAVGFWPIRRNGIVGSGGAGPPTPVEVLAVASLVVVVVCQALRATRPEANYDVLEYHVGAVHHWLREGRIFAFPHLFYASLPFEVEMWYAGGCFLEGNPLLAATPRLINIGLLVCALATVYALAAALCRQRGFRLLACLIVAIHPLTSIVAGDALNDLGLTWFAALATLAWLRWYVKRERIFFVLWAVFLGLTVCCKYTAVGFLILPAFLFLLPVGIFAAGRESVGTLEAPAEIRVTGLPRTLGRFCLDGLILATIVVAIFWPWAFKNSVQHGNPVYPLLSGLFPSPTWSPEQTQYYLSAHGQTTPLYADYWWSFLRNIERLGWWLIAAVLLGCFVMPVSLAAIALTLAVALGVLVHSYFPANPGRFMAPFLPILAALAARLIERVQVSVLPLRFVVMLPFVLWICLGAFTAVEPLRLRPWGSQLSRVGLGVFTEAPSFSNLLVYLFSDMSRRDILAGTLGPPVVSSQQFINGRTPPDSHVFLLYEARIGCFDRRVEVGSVFDKSPLLERAAEVSTGTALLRRLRREGFDYLYVNEYEMARLIDMYGPRNLPGGEPVLLFSQSDMSEAVKYSYRYPPYWLDPRYRSCRAIIEDFLDLCRRRTVYSMMPGFPYGIWIARLEDESSSSTAGGKP